MSTTDTGTSPSGWFARLIQVVIRVFIAIVVGLALGAGFYFGVTAWYNNVIQQIRANSQRIEEVETRLQSAEDQQKKQSDTLISRLQALEVSNDSQKIDLDEHQGRLNSLEAAQDTLLEKAQGELSTIMAAAAEGQEEIKNDLLDLDAGFKSLQTDINSLGKKVDALQGAIDEYSEKIALYEEQLTLLETEGNGYLSATADMQNQLQLFKTIEMITHSRYHLVQNNLGLARQDIELALDTWVELGKEIPQHQVDTYVEIRSQLESALANLPEKPVAAADNVDSAWYLLLVGLPDSSSEGEKPEFSPTQVPEAVPSPTPTPKP